MSIFFHALVGWLLAYALIGMAVSLSLSFGLIHFRAEMKELRRKEPSPDWAIFVACGICWWVMVLVALKGCIGLGAEK